MSGRVEMANASNSRRTRPDAACRRWSTASPQIPFLGVGKYQPRGRKAAPPICSSKDYPENGDKRVADLETALRNCGLRDGMVISNHHHLRDGDRVALMALEAAAKIGVKDLMWFPSASFPSQKGRNRADGKRRDPSHRRQHERTAGRLLHPGQDARHGRAALAWRALAGDSGWRSAHRHCGDCRAHGRFLWQCRRFAWKIRVRISGLCPGGFDVRRQRDRRHRQSGSVPLRALADSGQQCGFVVEVDSIGDPAKIVSGTTQITRSPDRLRIAEFVAKLSARRRNHAATDSPFRQERAESRLPSSSI